MDKVQDALALRDEICDTAAELRNEADFSFSSERRETATAYADSVEEKATDIGLWIEENNHVTEKQTEALEKMTGRHFVGYELNEEYIAIADERIRKWRAT